MVRFSRTALPSQPRNFGSKPTVFATLMAVLTVLSAQNLAAQNGDNWPVQVVEPAGDPAYTAGPEKAPKPTWPPAGKPVRVDFTEDDWFSACPGETMGNAGKAPQLKLKGQQEFFVFKTDVAALKGKIVTGALLHTRTATPDWPFRRVGVSTVSSPWTEGSATEAYKAIDGAPCFLQAEYKKRDWSFPGSTIQDVVMGRGCTIWGFADCTAPDANNWQAVAVDPRVIRANVAGVSHGYFVYDETGCEWSDTGNKFTWSVYPNRFCYSTQQNRNDAPWLEVWVDGDDKDAPAAVSQSKVVTDGFPEGEALVSWIVPDDNKGGSGVSGFDVEYFDKPGNKQILPRYLVPMAGAPGSECRLHFQDLPFKAGQKINLVIRAIDGAGNVSSPFNREVTLSATPRVFSIVKESLAPFAASEVLPTVGPLKVAVVDALDKIDPVSGEMIPAEPKGYLGGNHLFSGAQKLVRLQAGRNEAVDCQLVLNGTAADVKVEFKIEGDDKIATSIQEFAYVHADKRDLPDPLVACTGTVSIPSKAGEVHPENQQWHALILEAWVPHAATPGPKKGTITVSVGDQKLVLTVDLTVWDFTLPDTLSFVPEMNCYTSQLSPAQWHRLAHDHRTTINQLWYGWACNVGLPLKFNGTDFDWALFDDRVGPMLDGSMFKGCRRDAEPIPLMYLPFSESWPADLIPHFKASFWADEAFDDNYADEMKKSYAAFAKHADQKGWHKTLFEFFLNNKVYYREQA
ncbi:MAG TPA: hypothetical protein VL860_00280, partial [Planctomycetota bacterium]|nr:hypothetical protein [Planctomycetota bacterium]